MRQFVSRLSAAAEWAGTLAGAAAMVGLRAERVAEGKAGTVATAVWQAGSVGLVAVVAEARAEEVRAVVEADPQGGVRKCELLER